MFGRACGFSLNIHAAMISLRPEDYDLEELNLSDTLADPRTADIQGSENWH
jgi:hypothetical protein